MILDFLYLGVICEKSIHSEKILHVSQTSIFYPSSFFPYRRLNLYTVRASKKISEYVCARVCLCVCVYKQIQEAIEVYLHSQVR